ncbi:AI-2E family transporter [Flavihumibacter fluvii]|uniref:AI-2E family transporter n=1 Tax=Flavihumibacter fluvii TaxID=2838157 RepID=UPI001BDEC981|nr:AI-2E family transporter [Flavihumibacter fluvii]ULQ54112.1 AI-2E family transporter [Flavihumibacter fluvii]
MSKQLSSNSIYDTAIRLIILLVIIVWCLMIMYPFASIMLWSFILALALFPLHKKLSNKIGGKPKLAAVIIILSILVIVILPTGLLVYSLIDEVKALKSGYDNGTLAIPPPAENVKAWPIIGKKIYETWQTASVNLDQILLKYKDQLFDIGSKIAKGIFSAAGGVIQVIISLFIAGILLVIGGAGEAIRKFFRKVAGNKGDEFAELTAKTVRNVVKGIIGEALILALLNGILFLLAGIPYAGIWTFLVFVLAMLQMPVFFVTIPIMVYFFAVKEPMTAILWTISLLLVSLSDNILTPIMLGKDAPVPMVVVFIGVIGGFLLSGFIGLFTGAIVMSLGYTLFVDWINSNETETTIKN